ncbi:PREDICTED: PNMA-like protein 1 [Ceratotherium simum simum]|uniref:PNMA-like protein 1 n=1 Tax=Ceratotherium simum simum TaxID=73337 RepID=A0ABM0I510_CERSS|nr:PREDICTED: PNMA-like protein 1 [Ceratotherium simum simum]
MARSLLRDWCRGLDVDEHRALLVTGIPERLERAAIEAVLRPALLPLGAFRLRNTRAARNREAKAALVEFAEDIDHAAIPREIPGQDGVWRVLCKDRAEDTRVLRRMKRLLLEERPTQAAVAGAPGGTPSPPASETEAQGSEQAAGKAGPPPGAASGAGRGRGGRRNRARGNRVTQKGTKRGRGGWPSASARRESEDSSDESLGIVIEEVDGEDLSADEEQSALYATLQAAAKELVKKGALQGEADDGDGPREFLALVTVTDKAKKEEMEKGPRGAESISLDIAEDRSGVPDLVALLAVRDASDEETTGSDASESDSQENGDQEEEGVDNPEFVAIVAYTDPSNPSAQEMLKIASVIRSLGWSDKKDKRDALPEVLSLMAKDTSGPRVQVEEAGRQVDAMVLRKAEDDGNLLECISALVEPQTRPEGRKAPRGPLAGQGDGEDAEGGLLELVALLAAQDTAEVVEEDKEHAWEGGKVQCAKGKLGEVLALLAARGGRESDEDAEGASDEGSEEEASEDTEGEESEREHRASRTPRAKRARTASRALGAAGAPAPSGARKPRRGGRGRGGGGVTPEKKAQDEAAGHKKKKGRAGAGPRAKAGEAGGQPPSGSKAARGKKARGGRRPPPRRR